MDRIDSPPENASWDFCRRILTDVSRSFAIIIPECPPPLDRALCTAYLLCRVADTIEDEASLDECQRARLFDSLLTTVDHPADQAGVETFQSRWPEMEFSEPGYQELVRGLACVLQVYRTLPSALRMPIHRCVHDMVAGMRSIHPLESTHGVRFFCRDLADLDGYCHIVAGTVGIMTTAMFEWKLAERSFVATPAWREQGRRLGLGLQMTNIIKDCRIDAQRGVSFIPPAYVQSSASRYDLEPASRQKLFAHAMAHLDAGLEYTLVIPSPETGIRRFLLGSLLPAIATLELAAQAREFHPKIPRQEMARILELIADARTTDETLRSWYRNRRDRTLAGIARSAG